MQVLETTPDLSAVCTLMCSPNCSRTSASRPGTLAARSAPTRPTWEL